MDNTENKEIELGEKYLPLGTVVMLKGGTKRVMITGFCTVAQENQEKMFDYSGCIFPEGFIQSNQVCLFDHEQIEKVYHLGLIDDEEKEFKNNLKAVIEAIGEENILRANLEAFKEPEEVQEQAPSNPVMPTSTEIPSMPTVQQNSTSTEIPVMPESSSNQ